MENIQKKLFFCLLTILSFLVFIKTWFAEPVAIPGAEKIKDVSIGFIESGRDVTETTRKAGFKLLNFASMIVAGFALIYLVIMGVYMIVFSDSEDVIKKQKKQLLYVALGFLFLNVPSIVYDLFLADGGSIATTEFWNKEKAGKFFGGLKKFLQVLVFIFAAVMLTWSAFTLIASRGKEEYKKTTFNRFLYGIMALIFMGIIELWTYIFASGNIPWTLSSEMNGFISIAFYFVGPVAIFFLMVWGYYYITSAGDEERAKKWKAILFNTMIACVVLFSWFVFIKELGNLPFLNNR